MMYDSGIRAKIVLLANYWPTRRPELLDREYPAKWFAVQGY
jgi:hypothetical protein